MNVTIIDTTETEDGTMIWADVDGIEYGISDSFDVDTLQCDGTSCDCIDAESIANYNAISDSIQDAATEL